MSVIHPVRDIFTNGSSLRLINLTNIAPIPKVENPKSVSKYQPISLFNVSCKIITKIIIQLLKPLLDKCIFKNQGAFARVVQFRIIYSLPMKCL